MSALVRATLVRTATLLVLSQSLYSCRSVGGTASLQSVTSDSSMAAVAADYTNLLSSKRC